MKLRLHRTGTPGKPRWIWLHGFMGCGEDWRKLLAPWEAEFEFWLPDLPGHGGSPAAGLEETLEALGTLMPGAAGVAGYSMGGRLALMCAQRTPVRALLLESASIGLASDAERTARAELDHQRAQALRRDGLEAFLRDWYDMPLWNSLSPTQKQRALQEKRGGDAQALAEVLEAFSVARQPWALDWLQGAICPVLFLAGTLDPVYSALAQRLAHHAPHLRVQRVADAGHRIHLERPDAWRRQVHPFLLNPSSL